MLRVRVPPCRLAFDYLLIKNRSHGFQNTYVARAFWNIRHTRECTVLAGRVRFLSSSAKNHNIFILFSHAAIFKSTWPWTGADLKLARQSIKPEITRTNVAISYRTLPCKRGKQYDVVENARYYSAGGDHVLNY